MVKLVDFKRGQAGLGAEALSALRSLKGPIAVVVFIGDGRCGKSFLADRLAQHFGLPRGTFLSDSKQDAVTVGVDLAITTLQQEAAKVRSVANGDIARAPDGESAGPEEENAPLPTNIVILDCEGGTNAQAPIRQLVYVLATLMATQVVFVVGGQAGEPQLQNLAMTLAARQLIDTSKSGGKIASPVLQFVVNKKDPTLAEQKLEVLLREQYDDDRNKPRYAIKEEYPTRRCFSIPFSSAADFEARWAGLRDAIAGGVSSQPLTMSGAQVSGPQLAALVETTFQQMQQHHHVSFVDVQRHVIFDGYLKPLASKALEEFKGSLPDHSTYVKRMQDKRKAIAAQFAKATGHVSHAALKKEAADWLASGMDEAWNAASARNTAIGDQTVETNVERKESLMKSYKDKVGSVERNAVLGMLLGKTKDIHVNRGVYQSFSRSCSRKNNGTVEYSEWVECGQTDREMNHMCAPCFAFLARKRSASLVN